MNRGILALLDEPGELARIVERHKRERNAEAEQERKRARAKAELEDRLGINNSAPTGKRSRLTAHVKGWHHCRHGQKPLRNSS